MWSAALWLLPVVLSGVLWRLDLISEHQIRYEELAESVRSVFWFDHHLLYDGVYSNVGWYAMLLATYKILGFSLFLAKDVRLVLYLAGLLCLAALLRRAMPARAALVPLAAFGLSPALLYFATLQTTYGLDLSYAAICLWLLLSRPPGGRGTCVWVRYGLLGFTMMTAAMSYPVFLFYLPSFSLVALWWWRRTPAGWQARATAAVAGGAAFPLGAVFAWVRTPALLIFDPATHAGLFRGGGQFGMDAARLREALTAVTHDLFVRGESYYFDVTRPDFAGPLAWIALACIVSTVGVLIIRRDLDAWLAWTLPVLVVVGAVVPGLSTEGPPGLRRSTAVLAAAYAAFVLAWRHFATAERLGRAVRWSGLGLCALLLVAEVISLPSLAADLARDNPFQDRSWFAVAETPDASLDQLTREVAQGQKLACPVDHTGRIVPCRFQEIYPAIAGSREWNGLAAIAVNAVDWRTGQPITLAPDLWTTGYYPTCTRLELCR